MLGFEVDTNGTDALKSEPEEDVLRADVDDERSLTSAVSTSKPAKDINWVG